MDVIFDRNKNKIGFAHSECMPDYKHKKSRLVTPITEQLDKTIRRNFPIFNVVIVCCAITTLISIVILYLCKRKNSNIEITEDSQEP